MSEKFKEFIKSTENYFVTELLE